MQVQVKKKIQSKGRSVWAGELRKGFMEEERSSERFAQLSKWFTEETEPPVAQPEISPSVGGPTRIQK